MLPRLVSGRTTYIRRGPDALNAARRSRGNLALEGYVALTFQLAILINLDAHEVAIMNMILQMDLCLYTYLDCFFLIDGRCPHPIRNNYRRTISSFEDGEAYMMFRFDKESLRIMMTRFNLPEML